MLNTDIRSLAGHNSHQFMGKDGFLWWIGIVEDRNDPLGLGRARVRILGHHHERPAVLPTKDLPWALALSPLDNSTAAISPPHASWVLGFFIDGQLGQQPLMLGVLPGYRFKKVHSENSNTTPLPT